MQETQIRFLVQENSTLLWATKPVHHNYQASEPRVKALQQEEPQGWESQPCNKEEPLLTSTKESSSTAMKTQHNLKKNKTQQLLKALTKLSGSNGLGLCSADYQLAGYQWYNWVCPGAQSCPHCLLWFTSKLSEYLPLFFVSFLKYFMTYLFNMYITHTLLF